MTLVIDASVALKWFVDEDGPDQAAWLLTSLDSLIAPDLIVADLCNAGWKAVRGGGMTEAQHDHATARVVLAFDELVPSQPAVTQGGGVVTPSGPSRLRPLLPGTGRTA